MKKLILASMLAVCTAINAQEFSSIAISDWNKLKNSSFVESINSDNTFNYPPGGAPWTWGINIGHRGNNNPNLPANYNGQIAFSVNYGMDAPQMYIRSTNQQGEGHWAKVLHNLGNQEINGDLNLAGNLLLKSSLHLEYDHMIGRSLDNTFLYDNQQMGHYALRWGTDSWDFGGPTMWQSAYGGMKFFTEGKPRMVINRAGYIGIGTENPQNLLDVKGTIRAQEIKVELSGWADYVFDKDYKLPSLQEVELHIEQHKHLPGIPSEKQVLEEGVNMGEMQAKLLQKVEELTLYIIQQQKQIEKQQKVIDQLIEK